MRRGLWMALVSLFAIAALTVPALAADKSAMEKNDKSFVKSAATGGMMEVELGQLATKNAASQEVKDFGQRMVTDHGKANDELKSLAASKNIKLPEKMYAKQQEKIDKMTKLTGQEFDKKYMAAMVKDHEKDVKKFQKASQEAKDPDLKAWAAKTLPTLEKHLQMAKDLAKKVGAPTAKK